MNSRGESKISDFGLSKEIVSSSIHDKKEIVGTMIYQAPEHLDPSLQSDIGAKSDIWSVGLTVLEIALARFPTETDILFDPETKSAVDVIASIQAPRGNQSFSKEFVEFCAKCLIRIPADRPRASSLMVIEINKEIDFVLTHMLTPYDISGWLEDNGLVNND